MAASNTDYRDDDVPGDTPRELGDDDVAIALGRHRRHARRHGRLSGRRRDRRRGEARRIFSDTRRARGVTTAASTAPGPRERRRRRARLHGAGGRAAVLPPTRPGARTVDGPAPGRGATPELSGPRLGRRLSQSTTPRRSRRRSPTSRRRSRPPLLSRDPLLTMAWSFVVGVPVLAVIGMIVSAAVPRSRSRRSPVQIGRGLFVVGRGCADLAHAAPAGPRRRRPGRRRLPRTLVRR